MAGRIDIFVAELKRRRVFRVAVAYGVAAGGALQLASVVVPALHLPDWTLTAAVLFAGLGFPVAMVLAWTFDLTSAGVVRIPEAAPAPGAQRPAGVAVLVAAALLVAVAAGGVWWWLRPGASPPASREVVAVLPFTVRGSSQFGYLGEGMVDLLGASLSRGGALHTVDSRSVLRYVGREAGELDAERSRGVAAHFGAGLFVLGDVLEVERRLRIHAALYEVAKEGGPVTEATAEGDAGTLFALVDDLLRQLRAGLFGTRADGPAGRLVQLAQATTSSLPALKAYLEGEKAMRSRDWTAAQRAFQRAVDDDPSFALAQYRLAVSASWRHDPAVVRAAARRAQNGQDRLSPRERKMVGAFSELATGRIRKAEATYRELIAEEPDDEIGLGHALILAAQGRIAEARRLLDEAPEPRRTEIRAGAMTLPFLPVTRAHLLSAVEAVRRAGPRPGEERLQLYLLGLLLARATDAVGVEAQAAALERTTDEDGTSTGADLALAVRAHLAAWEGRPADALRLLEKMDLQVPYGAKGWPSGLQERMLRARVLRDLGRYAEALRWASTLDATLGDQVIWFAPVLLLQAELHERLGAREEAAAAYARVVELWKGCDPELRPHVEEARRKLEALHVATGKEARRSD